MSGHTNTVKLKFSCEALLQEKQAKEKQHISIRHTDTYYFIQMKNFKTFPNTSICTVSDNFVIVMQTLHIIKPLSKISSENQQSVIKL